MEDKVFEEEESAEPAWGFSTPVHPVCDRGRRIQSLRAFRQAGLKEKVDPRVLSRHGVEDDEGNNTYV